MKIKKGEAREKALGVVVLSDITIKKRGRALVDITKVRWTLERLENVEVKKEFKSKNNLDFLVVANRLPGLCLSLKEPSLSGVCEFAVFVKIENKWMLVADTHVILSVSELPIISHNLVVHIKTNSILTKA